MGKDERKKRKEKKNEEIIGLINSENDIRSSQYHFIGLLLLNSSCALVWSHFF
jgi:hypothetical protein